MLGIAPIVTDRQIRSYETASSSAMASRICRRSSRAAARARRWSGRRAPVAGGSRSRRSRHGSAGYNAHSEARERDAGERQSLPDVDQQRRHGGRLRRAPVCALSQGQDYVVLAVVLRGKRRDIGLGSCSKMSLVEARARARRLQIIARKGRSVETPATRPEQRSLRPVAYAIRR